MKYDKINNTLSAINFDFDSEELNLPRRSTPSRCLLFIPYQVEFSEGHTDIQDVGTYHCVTNFYPAFD